MVVEVPGLVQVSDVVGHLVPLAVLLSLRQIIAIGLDKTGFFQCLRTLNVIKYYFVTLSISSDLVQHSMEWLQSSKHASNILLSKEQSAGL